MSVLAGWAWDDAVLLEVARSSQADAAILLLALGLIGLLFSLLRIVGRWMDQRRLRRSIWRAHSGRGRARHASSGPGQARPGLSRQGQASQGSPYGAGDRRNVSTHPASRPSEARTKGENL